MSQGPRKPTLLEALFPVIVLISLLAVNVSIFGDDALAGSNQTVLLIAAAVAGLIAMGLGYNYQQVLDGILSSINSAMGSILILLIIGALAGTWLLSGIVPAMIYYGLKILNPTIFLFAAVIVSAIVSIATGSSWSTVATIGVALLGIGKAMGMSEGLIAGAVISGAYFGDKMSPLSDTTNLASAMAGTDLITHIKYMAYTTVPSILITLVIFLVIGFQRDGGDAVSNINPVLVSLENSFNINGWLFIVPLIVVFLIIKNVPALPALLAGALLGGLFALIFQPHIINQVSGIYDNPWTSGYVAVMKSMYGSISVTTDNELVNSLLSTKGMYGMLNTIWLIVCAMIFGGVMESAGMLKRITETIISVVHSTFSLVLSTVSTCIFFNITASDQYLAIVVPGRMFADTYRKRGLAPENLSRTLEDSGTVTSVLIPWNTCGATQAGVLGVATVLYLPYCFFNLISPLMTIIFAIFQIKLRKLPETVKA